MEKAVILLSGGLDSLTCLAIAKKEGFECYALSFDYGQLHKSELQQAEEIAKIYDVKKHLILPITYDPSAKSSLINSNISVLNAEREDNNGIPNTYVPARNTIFLSYALGWAEILEARDIFIGANCVDYSGYPDCRPEYLAAFEKMANLATKAGVEGQHLSIQAPLLHLTKAEIIQLGLSLGVDYSLSVSCYRADSAGKACGKCDSCDLRKKGFSEANAADVTKYFEIQ
jgi:7-cyano-7-deazaguanine synthase